MKPKLFALSSAVFLLCFSFAAVAQNAATAAKDAPPSAQSSPAQPQTQIVEPPPKLVLREGTDVKLKFAQALSSKTAAEGDPISLVLDEDLKVGDLTVAKAGAKAVGTVTHTKKGWHDG